MFIDVIAQEILSLVKDIELIVNECLIGFRYSYCEVSDGNDKYLGVAITLSEDLIGVRPTLKIPEKTSDLLEFISSPNPYDRVFGVAFLNAVSAYLLRKKHSDILRSVDIVDLLDKYIVEPVLIIGNMYPLYRKLVEHGIEEIFIVEKNPLYRGRDIYPDTSLPRLINRSRTIIITGATLVNDTIDYILEKTKDKVKILVGPTAAIYPYVLIPKYFDVVASMIPRDNEMVKKIIKAGGGRWDFSKYCDHYIVVSGEK